MDSHPRICLDMTNFQMVLHDVVESPDAHFTWCVCVLFYTQCIFASMATMYVVYTFCITSPIGQKSSVDPSMTAGKK